MSLSLSLVLCLLLARLSTARNTADKRLCGRGIDAGIRAHSSINAADAPHKPKRIATCPLATVTRVASWYLYRLLVPRGTVPCGLCSWQGMYLRAIQAFYRGVSAGQTQRRLFLTG
ncbi:hypothetical protein ACQKWADRAFT_283779 [Trichoderma austrokoningii]